MNARFAQTAVPLIVLCVGLVVPRSHADEKGSVLWQETTGSLSGGSGWEKHPDQEDKTLKFDGQVKYQRYSRNWSVMINPRLSWDQHRQEATSVDATTMVHDDTVLKFAGRAEVTYNWWGGFASDGDWVVFGPSGFVEGEKSRILGTNPDLEEHNHLTSRLAWSGGLALVFVAGSRPTPKICPTFTDKLTRLGKEAQQVAEEKADAEGNEIPGADSCGSLASRLGDLAQDARGRPLKSRLNPQRYRLRFFLGGGEAYWWIQHEHEDTGEETLEVRSPLPDSPSRARWTFSAEGSFQWGPINPYLNWQVHWTSGGKPSERHDHVETGVQIPLRGGWWFTSSMEYEKQRMEVDESIAHAVPHLGPTWKLKTGIFRIW